VTDKLAEAIHEQLEYRITASNNYRDTAQQIADHLRAKGFETSTWERVRTLERELARAQYAERTIRAQYQAYRARQARR